jgi:histidinol dehydrogenase
MRILHTDEALFESEFNRIKDRGKISSNSDIKKKVARILKEVEDEGDAALFRYSKKYDRVQLTKDCVEAKPEEIQAAMAEVSGEDLKILKTAAARIEKFHRKQMIKPVLDTKEKGIELGWLVRPLDRIGIYAPGGLAAYPSTVLMAAIPARVAGVKEIILVSPAKEGKLNPLVSAAAFLSGVSRIFKIGGAQAIAALAYGTESIPAVDKIVGPGNAYVAEAKRMVFGQVGIDMIAGPSEILIIADKKANPCCVAADLLSQAEHDNLASAVLITPSENLAKEVAAQVHSQLKELSRESIAAASIRDYGAIVVTANIAEAIRIANRFAPEHLELMVEKPATLLPQIANAGAVFLGNHTPEAIGDYIAGPSHILPTAGTARFSSPLGVYDFVKRSSIISFSQEALSRFGAQAARFAQLEGLQAHSKSISFRLSKRS